MNPKRVLLIDDDLELLRQMSQAFQGAGFDVAAAPDGRVGLLRFDKGHFDLVVCDLIMPTREGIETIVALRKAHPALRIIAISGGYRVGPQDFLDLARHVGADETLAKPFRLSDLLALSAKVLAVPAGSDV
ncbi:response regulator [uncultured Phenylobacterium sp.]|uniref:response regulator n=1 Tax=uncultured Phenylobacterium sp. TaxID=349273 RepID=UPI0025F44798|nr:response regulator [uncultured Phenylobacterium sp.]